MNMYAKIKSYNNIGSGFVDFVLEDGTEIKNVNVGFGGFLYGWGPKENIDLWLVKNSYVTAISPEKYKESEQKKWEEINKRLDGIRNFKLYKCFLGLFNKNWGNK